MSYHGRAAIVLVATLFAGSLPPAMGVGTLGEEPSDIVDVCFKVVNAAGWPLEGVNFTAVRTDISTPGATTHTNSGPDGLVRATMIRSAYTFLLRDNEPAVSPLRNGAVYLPTTVTEGGEAIVILPGEGGLTPNACGPGLPGYLLAGGRVTMASPPTQGYLQVTVRDVAAAGSPPLAGARIASATLDADVPPAAETTSVGALTNGTGVARLACVSGTMHNAVASKPAWLANATSILCAAPTVQTNLSVNLWRTPFAWMFEVTNGTTFLANAAGGSAPAVGPLTPLTNALASVTSRPADLSSAASFCTTASAATIDTRTPPLASAATGTPYVCSAPTDSLGRATLVVPWSDVASYEATVSAPGYAPHVQPRSFGAADVRDPTRLGVHRESVVLGRTPVTLSDRILDIHEAGLAGAAIFFNGSGPSYTATSGAGGAFLLALPTGPYDVAVTHDAKTVSACTAQVGVSDAGAALLALSRDTCFKLVATGKAAVIGKVADSKVTTAPIAGLMVCHGPAATTACDNTSADGSWEIETATGSSLSDATTGVRIAAGQDWDRFSPTISGTSGAAGSITDTGDRLANRKKITLTIHVRSETAPLAMADVNVHRVGLTPPIHVEPGNVTDASGNYVLPGSADTVWTTKVGFPQFDISPYVARANKHRHASDDATLYQLNASAAFHLPSTLNSHTETLTLDEHTGAVSVAILALDLNSGQQVSGVTLRATAGGGANAAAGGPDNINVTPGNFTLYPQFGPYRVCPVGDARYQGSTPEAQARCATGVNPGSGQDVIVPVLRTKVQITFRGVDAHTNWNLASFVASMSSPSNSITCDVPTAGFVCGPKTTNFSGDYQNGFSIPWTSGANDLCIQGEQRAYAAQSIALPQPHAGESVNFLASRYCQVWAPGVTPPTIIVRPLRAPAAVPIIGTVKLDGGAPAVGAIVNVTSERGGFVCDPEHNSTTSPYDACENTLVSATGDYSVAVPSGAAHTTWRATANLSGHYNETFNLWPSLAGVRGDFVLFPKDFQAIVTIVEQSVGVSPTVSQGCGHLQGYPVWARLKDMRDGDANPQNVGYRVRATPQADTTCLALIEITDWHRDPQPMPARLNQPWPVTRAPFIASTEHLNHVGYNLALLGPRDVDRRVTIVMVHPSTGESAAPHTLKGRISDADVIAPVSGATGVPSRVSVAPSAGSCVSAGASTITELDGSYDLPIACPGTHSITVTPLVATHWLGRTFEVTIASGQAMATADVAIERVESSVTVTVIKPLVGGNVFIDPKGVDVNADPASARTGAGGTVTFTSIPWGIYSFRAGGLIPQQAQMAFLAPGANSAIVVYV